MKLVQVSLTDLFYLFLIILWIITLALTTGCGRGPQGTPGVSSQSCTVEKASTITTITCPDGTEAEILDGDEGPQGLPGLPGLQGAAGPQGEAGTTVTMVQLCPNLGPPVYPTNFPEYAACIGGTLYGVYDASGTQVFLSALPPGAYFSTSPQSCAFTVEDNCQVIL